MPYETWLKAQAPPWLADPYGQAWLGGVGAALDDYVQQFIAGVLAAFPNYAPSDALAVIGDEIGLDKGPLESDASYAARLAGAWTAWKYAGTPLGVLAALYWSGFNNAVVVQQNGLYYQLTQPLVAGADPQLNLVVGNTSQLGAPLSSSVTPGRSIPAGTPWWTFDSNTDFCSRFAVLFPNGTSRGITYGTAVFSGTDFADVLWSNPDVFTDTSYTVLAGMPTITDGTPGVDVWHDSTMKTTVGTRIRASDFFTGTVEVVAFPAGNNPYAWFTAGDVLRMQNAIKKWRPAKATCVGIYVGIQGRLWGWPITTWGAPGLTWGAANQLILAGA